MHQSNTYFTGSGIFIAVLLILVLFPATFTIHAQTGPAEPSSDTTSSVAQANHNNTPVMFSSLGGSLPHLLTKEHSPYLVEADIFVMPGSTVSIEGGVVVLFSNFTSLHVQGAFYVKGTKENPVIFTSINDEVYNRNASVAAAPYDWNGIDIYESAIGTQLENCTVQYSVYGIRSQMHEIRILDSYFLQNGKSDVSIKDSTITIKANPFSYNSTQSVFVVRSNDTLNLTQQQGLSTGVTQPPSNKTQHSTLRQLLRYSGMVLATGCFAALALEYSRYEKAVNEFTLIDNKTDKNMQTYTSADWVTARNQVKRETAVTGLMAGMGALGVVFFGLSFTF